MCYGLSMNQVFHTHLGKGNRLSLPAPICQQFGLRPGMPITVVADESGLHLATTELALKFAQVLFTQYLKPGETPSKELIRDRREEAERD
jgi:hypothetical protein